MSKPARGNQGRRGRAVKGDRGHRAVFKPGRAAGPKDFDPEEAAKRFGLWWISGAGRNFIVRDDDRGQWATYPEARVCELLQEWFVSGRPRAGEQISEISRVFLFVMQHRRLERSIKAVAGYAPGIHTLGSEQVLVKTGPRLVDPVAGEWAIVRELIEGKLGPNQTPYFHGWMKTALEALFAGPGNFRPGQCCIFAGPRDSGKSRLQHQLITGLLGGRSADPGPYLFARTDFNSELAGSEHLLMEDPASSTKKADRIFFGEQLKGFVVNDTQRLHLKGRDALVVSAFHRLTISINDDPDKIRVLPLLTPDLKDKVHLFSVSSAPLPMPTSTLDERRAFREQIGRELPAYAYWLLNEFSIPAAIRSDRFGVRGWCHPSLALDLFDSTPAAHLLEILDTSIISELGCAAAQLWDLESMWKGEPGVAWQGRATDLERILFDASCNTSRQTTRLVRDNSLGRLLLRLAADMPERVEGKRTKLCRSWIIKRPVGGRE